MNKLAFWKWDFFHRIMDMIFGISNEAWYGTLCVFGKGYSESFFNNCPNNTFVYFDDRCEPVPCNAGGEDQLNWDIEPHGYGFKLKISWSVAGSRTIAWRVC